MSSRAIGTTPAKGVAEQVQAPTVRSLIDHWAADCPEEIFLISPETGRSVTLTELQAAACDAAGHLAGAGILPGQSVGYAMGNGYGAVAALLGCLYGGYRATAINLVAGAETVGYVLDHSQTRLVLTSPEAEPLVRDAMVRSGATPRVVMCDIDEGPKWQAEDPVADLAGELSKESIGTLMYTSGTTGQPKGVLLSHGNLIAGGQNVVAAHQLTRADRAYCVLPLYHINGLCVTLMGPLVSGGSVVMPHRYSARRFWDENTDNSSTWFSVVPTLISYLLHGDTDPPDGHTLRFGRSASAPLSPDVQSGFEERFNIPIVETMGLTETAAQILSNPLPPGIRKLGSPGIAFGNTVMIADDRQGEVPRGTEGEVLIRGDNVMSGYLDNPEATGDALTTDGWLRSGDLGRMDADGYVFITGRLKELIIKGGENIAPREIDEALYTHPAVIEAAAFPRSCADYGQTVEAGVKLVDDAVVSEADLIALCTDRIGAFKAPDKVHILPDLPKGPSGKIQRLKLAEMTSEAVLSSSRI